MRSIRPPASSNDGSCEFPVRPDGGSLRDARPCPSHGHTPYPTHPIPDSPRTRLVHRPSGVAIPSPAWQGSLPVGSRKPDARTMTAIIAPIALVPLLLTTPLSVGPVASSCPLPGWVGPVVADFAPPSERWGAGHRGVDVRGVSGSPVRSWASGRVYFSGDVGGKPVVSIALGSSSLGLAVDSSRVTRFTYEPVHSTLQPGDRVERGQVIGLLAEQGGHCAGGTCMHVGLRRGDEYLSPRSAWCAPVLKPWDEPERR